MNPIPPLSADLIEQLNQAIPAKCPSITDEERRIWFYAGQRALVESLIARQKATAQSPLEEKLNV